METITEVHLFHFLLQVLLLLGLSRGLAELFRRFNQPALTAEILVGILLGPTILGRVMPGAHQFIFPDNAVSHAMLETVAWVGILFFLLNNGLEMDFSSAWRQKKDALIIAVSDVILPIIIAFIPCMFLPDSYLADPSRRVLFALFAATIMTISAMPVTARILGELNIFKTDMGFMIMCALSINDLIGWVIFTQVLGVFSQSGVQWGPTLLMVAGTLVFTGMALTAGRRWVDSAIRRIYRHNLPEPGSSLTFVCLAGILCGMLTIRIGIHALFGFFIAGILAGESKALPDKTRHVISQMVHAIFIPLFFAGIGLKVDFFANFDIGLAAFFLIIGTVGRFYGAWVGVNLSGQSKTDRLLISIAHTPGGEMQIVVSLMALQYGLLTETVFVAIIFGAVVSSVVLGPWMTWALNRRRHGRDFLLCDALLRLTASARDEAILELCTLAAPRAGQTDAGELARIVTARENSMSTAMEYGVAIPHGRIPGLREATVVFGRSPEGIEWNAPDGAPARLIFLVLTAPDDPSQLQILRSIALAVRNPSVRRALLDAPDHRNLLNVLRETLAPVPPVAPPEPSGTVK
jgi:Kef-type K+ transport system membrane component KefB